LTANYAAGGPSAGFALTINTLSVLLNLEVMNDFGITGAPWAGGITKKDVGSPVIIGGVEFKADVVLTAEPLRRMFVPHKNYSQITQAELDSYWAEGKTVNPVYNFRQLVPEVYAFNDNHIKELDQLLKLQIGYNIANAENNTEDSEKLRISVDELTGKMKRQAEVEIIRRAKCLYNFAFEKNPQKNALAFPSIYEVGGHFDSKPKPVKFT